MSAKVEESNKEDSVKSKGAPVSGRAWKHEKDQFRVKSRVVKNKKLSSWQLREQKRLEDKQFKERMKSLKDEKDEERKRKIQALKERREKKAEEERYQLLAAKMHAKKVERMRRREKRNKALKER